MSFNPRRAGYGIAETIRTLAEPRQMTALAGYGPGVVTLRVAEGAPDVRAVATAGWSSERGGWETSRANYWSNQATGGVL